MKKISATGKIIVFARAKFSLPRKRLKNGRSLEWFLSLRQWSKQWLTFEEQNKNHRQLVDGLAQNVLHHGAGDERLGSAVRFPGQQILRRRFRGERQRRQRVHDQVHPQHLHRTQWRVLSTQHENTTWKNREEINLPLPLFSGAPSCSLGGGVDFFRQGVPLRRVSHSRIQKR